MLNSTNKAALSMVVFTYMYTYGVLASYYLYGSLINWTFDFREWGLGSSRWLDVLLFMAWLISAAVPFFGWLRWDTSNEEC